MWLVFLLFFFSLGILNSNIEVNLYRFELKNKDFKLKLVISLKLFGIIKILNLKFNENGVRFLNKKFTYKLLMKKIRRSNLKISKVNKDYLKQIDEQLNIKLNRSYFKLKIGLLDITLTNIIVVILSSVFPLLVKSKIHENNLNYEILPEYNKLRIFFNGKFSISVKFLNLVRLYFKNIKPEITHNKSKNYDVKESF